VYFANTNSANLFENSLHFLYSIKAQSFSAYLAKVHIFTLRIPQIYTVSSSIFGKVHINSRYFFLPACCSLLIFGFWFLHLSNTNGAKIKCLKGCRFFRFKPAIQIFVHSTYSLYKLNFIQHILYVQFHSRYSQFMYKSSLLHFIRTCIVSMLSKKHNKFHIISV
jgi:hypothetical protein